MESSHLKILIITNGFVILMYHMIWLFDIIKKNRCLFTFPYLSYKKLLFAFVCSFESGSTQGPYIVIDYCIS